MKVLTFSTTFPKGHPRIGQPTYFIEQILNSILPRGENGIINRDDIAPEILPFINDFVLLDGQLQKHHTIRAGSRWKAGDMASLRIWSGKPYQSKQIEFAQVEVKRVWSIEINNRFGAASFEVVINGTIYGQLHFGNDKDQNEAGLITLAKNDGLELQDFVDWFEIHPKKKEAVFKGQVICWATKISYDAGKENRDL